MLNILFVILGVIIWLSAMIIVILGCLWIVQVECKEMFNADIFIRLREKLHIKLAPKSDTVFYGKDDMFYIKVPRESMVALINEVQNKH